MRLDPLRSPGGARAALRTRRTTPGRSGTLNRRGAAGGLLAFALLGAACIRDPATQQGEGVADLYVWFMIAAAAVFVVVSGLLAWSLIRYRGDPGRDASIPPQTHGNLVLEAVWWAIPTLLVVVLVFLTADVLADVDARADEPELEVEVIAFQWGWRFEFPDTGVAVTGTAADPPTVVLPTDRTIAFLITSTDVNHSFNIPPFLIKRDAIPGNPNRFDVVIDEAGTYTGQCGEFCGLLHSAQYFAIEAVPPDEFEDWLAAAADAGDGGAEAAP